MASFHTDKFPGQTAVPDALANQGQTASLGVILFPALLQNEFGHNILPKSEIFAQEDIALFYL